MKRIEPPRQLPGRVLVLIDIVLTGIVLIVFALFDHVIPREPAAPAVTQAPQVITEVTPPPAGAETPAGLPDEEPPAADPGDFSLKFADKFTDGEVIADEYSYRSPNISVTLTAHDEYLEGVTYRGEGLPASMYGLKVAYNPDGGKTSQMAFRNRPVNRPYRNGRSTGDIVYIGEAE